MNYNLSYALGILDSDVDPTNLTYVIPGNDDSSQSILFYHKVFANAIQRAKKVKQVMQLSVSSYVSITMALQILTYFD